MLEWLKQAGLAVPKPLALEATPGFCGDPFILMSFEAGESGAQGDECIQAMANELAAIHRLPVRGLPDLPLRLDPLPELLTFLPDEPAWAAARSLLSGLGATAYQGEPVLLHGDFWPENIIWRDGNIGAILDWEDAALGDPLSDVACTRLELRYVYGPSGAHSFTRFYETHLEIDHQRLALWDAYVSAGSLLYMGEWRLPPNREAHMRETATAFLNEAMTRLSSAVGGSGV